MVAWLTSGEIKDGEDESTVAHFAFCQHHQSKSTCHTPEMFNLEERMEEFSRSALLCNCSPH